MLEAVLAGLEGELGPRRGEPVSLDGCITNRNLRVRFAWGVVDAYRDTARQRGGAIPDSFAPLRAKAERIREALTDPELDFDFVAYADEHLGRVATAFADPRLDRWLQDAHG